MVADLEPWGDGRLRDALGGAVALVADEALVPVAGLSGLSWEPPPSTHVCALASHLVFGAALEGARRVLLRFL